MESDPKEEQFYVVQVEKGSGVRSGPRRMCLSKTRGTVTPGEEDRRTKGEGEERWALDDDHVN